MRTKLVQGNKAEKFIHCVKNAETVAIPKGTPLVLNLTGTPQPTSAANGLPAGIEDGLQVVLPATAGALASQYYNYGVAVNEIAASQLGEAQVHGLVSYALIKRATRAASTDSWTSSASVAASLLLTIDTIDNALTTIASTGTVNSNTTVTLYNTQAFGILVDSIASFAASASATSDARTVMTTLKRVFLRQM